MASLDWSQCSAVESIPGKRSGAWVCRDTPRPVSVMFENLPIGETVDEVTYWLPATREQVSEVLECAARTWTLLRQCKARPGTSMFDDRAHETAPMAAVGMAQRGLQKNRDGGGGVIANLHRSAKLSSFGAGAFPVLKISWIQALMRSF